MSAVKKVDPPTVPIIDLIDDSPDKRNDAVSQHFSNTIAGLPDFSW
jgi:hypothetical protein